MCNFADWRTLMFQRASLHLEGPRIQDEYNIPFFKGFLRIEYHINEY